MAEITIDNKIRIPGLSQSWIEGLSKLVSIENEDKETAIKEEVWGAHKLDDLLTLADLEDGQLVLPRGFHLELENLIKESKLFTIFKWQDNTIFDSDNLEFSKYPELRDYQQEALIEMGDKQQGRVIAPPGKGKTVMGLSLIGLLKRPALVLVSQKHIAKQWQERSEQHLGYTPGFIGDQKWDEKDFSVALIQTLWSRKEELDEKNWWDKWSIVILDEQHHIPAETFTAVVSSFPARYRIGLSATVGKSEAKKRISELVFGPIIYETEQTGVDPEIHVIKTDFEFEFVPTQRINGKRVQNNYQKLIQELVKDSRRNSLIASKVFDNREHANLIFSKRLKHLETLRDLVIELGFPEEHCWMLTGKEPLEERMEIYERAESGNCAIFSTVADEALDIPRLDRGYLAFPQKNEETIKQQIGRFGREHEDKQDAIVYDFVDWNIPVIKAQYGNRLRKLYQRLKLKVQILKTL